MGDGGFGVGIATSKPFVSSEVETPIDDTPGPKGISTSLDANGLGGPNVRYRSLAVFASVKTAFLKNIAMIYPVG